MGAFASASSIDQILNKIQTILKKQSSGESEIEILRKEIDDQIEKADDRARVILKQQLGIVTYFSLFPDLPEGCMFPDAERLIHLWIAEGFCNSSEDGRRCLSNLVGSSILQDVKKDEFGQVRSCRMHPRMHNIAKSVDSNRENIMITKANPTDVDYNTVLRALFYLPDSQVPKELYSKAKQLKSIIFFNTVEQQQGKLDLEKIFKKFKKLRVLDLRNLGIKDVPSSIGDLKDLEHLDLSRNKMKKLPSSIAKLSKLHTLILFVCFQGPSLPDWLTSLKSLVKLSLQDCHGCKFKYLSKHDDHLPNLKILELVNLQHLEYITEKCNNKEAAFYKSLEEMTIKNCNKLKSWWKNETDESPRPSFAKISKLHICRCSVLQTMPLYPGLDKKMVLHSCTLNLLRLNTESIPLKNLHIQHCNDSTNLSGVFQHLSSLECLTIEHCDTTSLTGESNAWEGLKSLSFLKLKDFNNLKSLSFGDDVTTLKELTVERCPNLTSISDSKLTSLQELTLRSCVGLKSISDSIGQVTSLRMLEISDCQELESLPETILKCFKSQLILRIFDCKLLQPKFVSETGVYWQRIGDKTDLQVQPTKHG